MNSWTLQGTQVWPVQYNRILWERLFFITISTSWTYHKQNAKHCLPKRSSVREITSMASKRVQMTAVLAVWDSSNGMLSCVQQKSPWHASVHRDNLKIAGQVQDGQVSLQDKHKSTDRLVVRFRGWWCNPPMPACPICWLVGCLRTLHRNQVWPVKCYCGKAYYSEPLASSLVHEFASMASKHV